MTATAGPRSFRLEYDADLLRFVEKVLRKTGWSLGDAAAVTCPKVA